MRNIKFIHCMYMLQCTRMKTVTKTTYETRIMDFTHSVRDIHDILSEYTLMHVFFSNVCFELCNLGLI